MAITAAEGAARTGRHRLLKEGSEGFSGAQVASLVIAAPVRRAAAGNRHRKRRMSLMPRMISVWMSPISRTERRQQWRLSRRDGLILIIITTKGEKQQATRTAVGSWVFMGCLTSLRTRCLLSIEWGLCRRLG